MEHDLSCFLCISWLMVFTFTSPSVAAGRDKLDPYRLRHNMAHNLLKLHDIEVKL